MPRPTNKKELINAANTEIENLLNLIDSIPKKERLSDFGFTEDDYGKEKHWKRDKNIKDVLVHLYEWHLLLIRFVNENLEGKTIPFLPKPYNWKTYGKMNVEFWKKHKNTTYEEALENVKNSHKEVMKIINKLNEKELFTKKYFNWAGASSLGSYCVSSTSSHYEWATKKIKKYIKKIKN